MSVAKPAIPKRALEKFLAELKEGASVTEAAETAHIGRRTAYDYRAIDEDFASRWDDAIEARTDRLEVEGERRAMQGSDTLLMFLLRGRRRSVYGEKVEVNAQVQAVTSAELAAARAAADENPEAMAALARSLAVGLDA